MKMKTQQPKTYGTLKAVLRGRFIAIQVYLKRQEKSQINNLTLHLKQLEKEEIKNPRVSRRKEILKIRAEIFMTQQSHCWAYTLRKPEVKQTHVPQCSSQHCL